MTGIDSGTTAWVLVSAALVLFMTPGLAFFYGGMSRSASVLNMLMMSFSAIGIVSIVWVLYGYSLAFGPDAGAGLVGQPAPGRPAHDHRGERHERPARPGLRRLPDDVRGHHPRPDQRRGRRPDEVRCLRAVRHPVGVGRLRPGRPLGVRRRHGRLDRQALSVLAYSFVLTLVLAYVVQAVIGLRVDAREDAVGLDQVTHAGTAYDLLGLAGRMGTSGTTRLGRLPAPTGGLG